MRKEGQTVGKVLMVGSLSCLVLHENHSMNFNILSVSKGVTTLAVQWSPDKLTSRVHNSVYDCLSAQAKSCLHRSFPMDWTVVLEAIYS